MVSVTSLKSHWIKHDVHFQLMFYGRATKWLTSHERMSARKCSATVWQTSVISSFPLLKAAIIMNIAHLFMMKQELFFFIVLLCEWYDWLCLFVSTKFSRASSLQARDYDNNEFHLKIQRCRWEKRSLENPDSDACICGSVFPLWSVFFCLHLHISTCVSPDPPSLLLWFLCLQVCPRCFYRAHLYFFMSALVPILNK